MSKYTIAGKVISVTHNASKSMYHIVLVPGTDYQISRVVSKNTDLVLFRPDKDDGRAEIAYFNKSIEIEVSTANKHAATFYAMWKTKAHWKFGFNPSKKYGDAMIFVCDMLASGRLVRKALNKNPNGLKITAIV